jgi:predicted small metal-binding protein
MRTDLYVQILVIHISSTHGLTQIERYVTTPY